MPLFKNTKIIFSFLILILSLNVNASGHRWEEEGVPHKGWLPQGVNIRGDRDGDCQFCSQKIKYEHVLSHPDFHEDRVAGSVCAKKLAKPYSTQIDAHKREAINKASRAARRAKKIEANKRARLERVKAKKRVRLERVKANKRARQIEAEEERQVAFELPLLSDKDQWVQNGWRQKNETSYGKCLSHGNWVNIFKRNNVWKFVNNNKFSNPYATLQLAKEAAYEKLMR